MLSGDHVAGGFSLGAEGGVALVEAGVEVAVDGLGDGRALAAEAVGLDVAAEIEFHWFSTIFWGYPLPWGYFGWKSNGCNKIARVCSAKILQPWDLRLKYSQ